MDYHSVFILVHAVLKGFLLAGIVPFDIVLIISFIGLMLFSFVASGSEVAFFSLTFKDINMLKTKTDSSAKRIVRLIETPRELMASLVACNIICNICIFLVANLSINRIMDGLHLDHRGFVWILLIKVIIITFLVILFCQVLPKVWATQSNLFFALFFSPMIDSLVFPVFKRIGMWFSGMGDSLEKKLNWKASAKSNASELDYDIDLMSEDEASVEQKQILKGIYKFSNIIVKQVMRTRLDVNGVEYSSSFREVIKRVEELHYSRLPVFRDSIDNIVGMLHTKDLLPHLDETDAFDWHSLLRQPFFVHEQKLIEDLLKEFQQKRTHFAVVVDEFGGTSGIVTMEDILEEIVGEIKDEFDEDDFSNEKLDEFNYIFDGKTMLHDVCKMMNLPAVTFDQVKGGSDSLAGLVLEQAGKFPEVNEVINCGDFDFTVLEISKNRLQKIKVTIKPMLA